MSICVQPCCLQDGYKILFATTSQCGDPSFLISLAHTPRAALTAEYTSWASREVVLMYAGRFSNQIFEKHPEIWYGHSSQAGPAEKWIYTVGAISHLTGNELGRDPHIKSIV